MGVTSVFADDDFRVFDVTGFQERMHAIRQRIQPKLTGIGELLAPMLSELVDQPLYAHVAKHARRTVHPPDDTWVAFGADRRGYKKDVHFRVAISAHAVRLLWVVGPDYYDKDGWSRKWKRGFASVDSELAAARGLEWFRDEHDEAPTARLSRLDRTARRDLAADLVRRRDGQLVLGRRLEPAKVVGMDARKFGNEARKTFRPVATLFGLHDRRVRGD
jgi:uncharacterized protein YktB (UPF0637 family)